MNTAGIYVICLTYGLFNLFTICLLIFLANLHDIRQLKRRSIAKESGIKPGHAPLMRFTILVPAHNEERVIARCLNSLVELDYKDFEVIIINDGSRDYTDRAIRAALINIQHTEQANKKGIRFLYIGVPRNRGKASVLNEGLAYANGEVVVCMDADAILKKDALTRAAVYFSDPSVAVIAANNKLVVGNSWLDILQRFDFIANYRSKKAYDF
jgi:cellulose synthase/poly-beta-1,6-N-acetylglucosamine synthase-like glycosyltransferase